MVDHETELFAYIGAVRAGITGVRDEEAQGVVAPVVAQVFFEQVRLGDMQVHRQQAQGGNAELSVVRQHGWADQTSIGAPQRFRHVGVALRQAFDMRFVQYGGIEWNARAFCHACTSLPLLGPVEHTRFGNACRVVGWVRQGVEHGGIR